MGVKLGHNLLHMKSQETLVFFLELSWDLYREEGGAYCHGNTISDQSGPLHMQVQRSTHQCDLYTGKCSTYGGIFFLPTSRTIMTV